MIRQDTINGEDHNYGAVLRQGPVNATDLTLNTIGKPKQTEF